MDAPGQKITVISIDDHAIISEGIRSYLAPYPALALVAQGTAGEDIFPLVEQHRPDVLILDLSMPSRRRPPGASSWPTLGPAKGEPEPFYPIQTIARLRREYPQTAVIILTMLYVPDLVQRAVALGVGGYLLKSDDMAVHLPAAVLAVGRGRVYFSDSIVGLLFQTGQRRAGSTYRLTGRQLEALRMYVARPEASYAELAATMQISRHTYKRHLAGAFRALGVTNIAAGILRAFELGLLRPPGQPPG